MLDINLKKLRPYGDRLDDGAVQLSFTLPVKVSPEAKEAARQYAEKLNLERVSVAAMESMGEQFTFFTVYGHAKPTIDMTKIRVHKIDFPDLTCEELKHVMDTHLDRALVVVGACTGFDAHTVGIDAILNLKGYAGDHGLECYPKFKVYNLRSQLKNAELIERAVALKADALLVSQVVTQRDSHITNLKELKELILEEKRLPRHLITIIGGPRIDHQLAAKLGFDAGFGAETKPSQVASFIVKEFLKRTGIPLKLERRTETPTMQETPSPTTHKHSSIQQIREDAMRAAREKQRPTPSPRMHKPPHGTRRRGRRRPSRRQTT